MHALEFLMSADALRIERARARVLAALGLPDAFTEGDACAVDLDRAWFTATRDGEVAFAGPCQLVAVQRDGAWRWAFEQPGVPPGVVASVQALVRGDGALYGVASTLGDDDDALALRFATWIALRTGFVGAYPAELRGAKVLLALALARGGVDADEARCWCSACGRAAARGSSVDEVALCAACVQDLRSLGEPHPTDKRRVIFEGTLRTPKDLMTLRAALGAAPSISLTEIGNSRVTDALRALCLVCGRARARADVLVLNDAFTICPKCADACANGA